MSICEGDTDFTAVQQREAVAMLKKSLSEGTLWKCVVMFRDCRLKTMSGLPFSYKLKIGHDGEFTKEIWIDRRKNSKSLA